MERVLSTKSFKNVNVDGSNTSFTDQLSDKKKIAEAPQVVLSESGLTQKCLTQHNFLLETSKKEQHEGGYSLINSKSEGGRETPPPLHIRQYSMRQNSYKKRVSDHSKPKPFQLEKSKLEQTQLSRDPSIVSALTSRWSMTVNTDREIQRIVSRKPFQDVASSQVQVSKPEEMAKQIGSQQVSISDKLDEECNENIQKVIEQLSSANTVDDNVPQPDKLEQLLAESWDGN
eukprot:TRINITY_DN7006_c0_g1_i2.p2 TRINITY_DN7006_c0_g1~~TRINITY_DN7006_c0_g1_i2.p2  ORF type:complete len:230 (-),score=32.40 TRINITY_DN7006_c0_g1_i2:278-967(-)